MKEVDSCSEVSAEFRAGDLKLELITSFDLLRTTTTYSSSGHETFVKNQILDLPYNFGRGGLGILWDMLSIPVYASRYLGSRTGMAKDRFGLWSLPRTVASVSIPNEARLHACRPHRCNSVLGKKLKPIVRQN